MKGQDPFFEIEASEICLCEASGFDLGDSERQTDEIDIQREIESGIGDPDDGLLTQKVNETDFGPLRIEVDTPKINFVQEVLVKSF